MHNGKLVQVQQTLYGARDAEEVHKCQWSRRRQHVRAEPTERTRRISFNNEHASVTLCFDEVDELESHVAKSPPSHHGIWMYLSA